MKEIGLKINNMDMELKHGLMDVVMREIMIWAKSMEKAYFYGLINLSMKDNLFLIMYIAFYFYKFIILFFLKNKMEGIGVY